MTREGTRPLLVEVQALVDQSPLANPRRVALGLEQNRLSMLLAVMHRHGGIAMFDQDVFLNVVGGVRVTEPAADLPVLLAVCPACATGRCQVIATFGEVGPGGDPAGAERPGAPASRRPARFQARHRAVANAPKKPIAGPEVVASAGVGEAIDRRDGWSWRIAQPAIHRRLRSRQRAVGEV